jgi:peptidoglycan/LPS O-acetylase OafA/YrhL
VYVIAHHVIGSTDAPGVVQAAFSFGQEAVLVFFLLSGFVIFANEKHRVASPRGYYIRRIRRIYPPILLAMLVSTCLWLLGLLRADPTWTSLIGTLFSLQDIAFLKPGVVTTPYLGNNPLWSLSYEVFFYAVFPLVMIAWRRSQVLTRHSVGLIACIAYGTYMLVPNHFSLVIAYFLIWWVGAMCAKTYLDGNLSMRAMVPEISWLAILTVVAGLGVALTGFTGLGYFPFLMVRHFLVSLIITLVLFTPVRIWMASLSVKLARPVTAISSISFGLYILHYPLLVQSGASTGAWIAPALALTIALAYVADRVIPRVLPAAPRD